MDKPVRWRSAHGLLLVFAMCLSLSLSLESYKAEDGYETFPAVPGSQYKLYTLHLTWAEAWSICQGDGDGSHLVVINSEEEAGVVKEMFDRIIDSTVIELAVGINDIVTEGTWVTIQGDLVSTSGYNKWAPGQPDNAIGTEDCGALLRDLTYEDVICDLNLRTFICERPTI